VTTRIAIINFGPGVVRVTPVNEEGKPFAEGEVVGAYQVSSEVRYAYPGMKFIIEEIHG
jgi:hypothetical protein